MMYFDTNESSSHKKSKEKLFDLITQKRVEILDHHLNKYDIFKGNYDKEFLHMESFIMDYSKDVLFSNSNSPCIKHLKELNKNGLCDVNGYYGAFKELPCEKCVKMNFRKYIEGSSKYASYRPDISFGYEGIHKIWLEIKNESPCSKNKIEFCKQNNIILLEISDNDVLKFNDFNGKLTFTRLEEYKHVASIYEDIENILTYVKKELSENKFVYHQEVINKLINAPSSEEFLKPRNLVLLIKRIDKEFSVICVEGKELKNHFGIKKKNKIIITKDEYDNLINMNYITKEKKTNTIKIVEPSSSDKMVKCFKCKGKEQAKNLIKAEWKIMHGKQTYKYYHEDCLK